MKWLRKYMAMQEKEHLLKSIPANKSSASNLRAIYTIGKSDY
jgi:hypothetical protein